MIFRMTCMGCYLLTSIISAALAQGSRVTVLDPGEKELKRSSHRLHMQPAQLKNARELLQQATALARNLDPMPAPQMATLAQLWCQLDRPQASASLKSLLDYIRSAAEQASDLSAFHQISFTFQNVLQVLAEVDSESALDEIRQWPRPPQAAGEAAVGLRSQLIGQFQRQLVQRLTYQDPEKAAELYGALDSSTAIDYYTPGQLALQLASAGEKERAYRLVDQIIAGYRNQAPNADRFQNFIGFVQQLPGLDPDRFMQAFSLVAAQANTMLPGISDGTLKVGDNSVQLSGSDLRMLDVFRSLSGRPDLLQRALEALPGFRSKFDGIGGIDNALSPSLAVGGTYSIVYASGGGMVQSAGPPSATDPFSTLFRELKGKATKSPGLVRQKLSQAVKGSDNVDLLINLAQRSSYEDPDLGSLALEVAAPLLSQVQPLQRRSMLLQEFAQASRQCNGDVDTELLREGFVLVDQLREEEQEANPEAAKQQGGSSMSDSLEQALLAQVAVDHFDEAVKYLRAMPNGPGKLNAQLRVIDALRRAY